MYQYQQQLQQHKLHQENQSMAGSQHNSANNNPVQPQPNFTIQPQQVQ